MQRNRYFINSIKYGFYHTEASTMLKRTVTLSTLLIATYGLSACMYYADFDRKRADTEQTRQKTAMIEAYSTCLKANPTQPERCPKPAY